MVQIVEPTSIAEAVGIVRDADGDAKYLAGGTALVLLVKLRMVNPTTLVSLRGVADLPGWRDVVVGGGRVRIGGGVTLARLASHPVIRGVLPSLAHAAKVVGNTRIRNCATVGGVMAEADYASDPPAALVSLGASVLVSDGRRERDIAAADFVTDFFTTELEPEEIVTHVSVPVREADVRSVYLKFASRSEEDRPCVGVATSGVFEQDAVAGLRVVVGAVAGCPQFFPEITGAALGGPLTERVVARVAEGYAEAVDPVDDIRGSGWYRREVVRAQVARSLRQIGTRGGTGGGA